MADPLKTEMKMASAATPAAKASGQGRARERIDPYQLITDRIIEQLEAGIVPWHKSWIGGEPPANLRSKRPYRGINTFLLSCAPYTSPYWVTFRQALSLGGSVKKGAKGWPVVFWKWLDKKDAGGAVDKRIPLLRRYTVFNASDQCEGLEVPELQQPACDWDPIVAAEEIVSSFASAPAIEYGGFAASYSPTLDRVQMPERKMFPKACEFFSTLFHELGHATGHNNRLNRSGVTDLNAFGTHAYAREELVAEMTAAYLSGHAGILHGTLDNSAAYLRGWLSKLRGDKRLVIGAAAQAQRAADLIRGVTFEASGSNSVSSSEAAPA